MTTADCQKPCNPCHFGGYKVDENARVQVPERDLPDCRNLANEAREPICREPVCLPEPGAPGTIGEDQRPVPSGDPPCYLPQPADATGRKDGDSEMGPIGPWATGRVDWGPLAGLTGTRPVVSKYSITRYSGGEWRQRNAELLNDNYLQQDESQLVQFKSHECLEKSKAKTDKDQSDSTKRCQQRASDIHRWKCELERAIEAAIEELTLLKEEHSRLKQAMAILMVPESIASESLDIRTGRFEPDLVRDQVEEELVKELSLTAEIRDVFTRTLADLTEMIVEEKAARQRLEYDWSDKKTSFDVEALNVGLNNKSSIIMFRPGATRFAADQSTPEFWEHFTRESLEQAEKTRQKAVNLRGTLDAILINASRDLRTQADKVDMALANHIQCTEELRIKMENELNKVLVQLVDNEKLINKLGETIRNMDFPMKVAQTRLDNKLAVPRVENCREASQLGLIAEVNSISNTVASLNAQLGQAEAVKTKLLNTRSNLEREIMIKLKTLQIDKERIGLLRTHYPSATALSGY